MMLKLRTGLFLIAFAFISATPALSQNFSQLVLSLADNGGTAVARVTGKTQGAYDLSLLAQNGRDIKGNHCLGWATQDPDHLMVLEGELSSLELKVNSRGKDTTLVIKSPNGDILCGDDLGSSPDAGITIKDGEDDGFLEAGTYNVWIGTDEPNQSWSYTLSAKAK